MLGHYMSSPGFGMYGNHEYGLGGTMMSLQDVTRAKFGQPGVDAMQAMGRPLTRAEQQRLRGNTLGQDINLDISKRISDAAMKVENAQGAKEALPDAELVTEEKGSPITFILVASVLVVIVIALTISSFTSGEGDPFSLIRGIFSQGN